MSLKQKEQESKTPPLRMKRTQKVEARSPPIQKKQTLMLMTTRVKKRTPPKRRPMTCSKTETPSLKTR